MLKNKNSPFRDPTDLKFLPVPLFSCCLKKSFFKVIGFLRILYIFFKIYSGSITMDPDTNCAKILDPDPNCAKILDPDPKSMYLTPLHL